MGAGEGARPVVLWRADEWSWVLGSDGRLRGRTATSVAPFMFQVNVRATKTPGMYQVQGSVLVDGYTVCTRFERQSFDVPSLTPDAVLEIVRDAGLVDECLAGAAGLIRRAFDAVRVTDL